MLDSACREAEAVLLDRRYFTLSEDVFKRFTAMLDKPPRSTWNGAKADTAFSDIAALRPWECNLTADGEPERLGGARVSTNFFTFLGVPIARGLRIALGATRSDVLRWVFSNGMQPVVIGLFAGLAGVIAIARTLRSLLFGIAPTDPVSLGGVVLVLLLTSGLACYLPARRAAALDPMTALRHE